MAKAALGRPRKYDNPLYFGMKVTPEEKAAIKRLAEINKRPASQTIMALVQEALVNYNQNVTPLRISTAELRALPPAKQKQILEEQAQKIAHLHEVFEHNEDIQEDE